MPAGLGSQLQSPTLGFLIGGIVIAALGSELQIPDAIVVASIYLSKKRGTPDEELSKQEYLSQESVAGGEYPSEPEYPTSRQEYRRQQRITASGYPSEQRERVNRF